MPFVRHDHADAESEVEENCQDGQRCLTHSLWDDLSQQIFVFLSDITLHDLVQRGEMREAARREKKAASQVVGLKHQAA